MADIVPPPIHPSRGPVPDWADDFWSRVGFTDSCWLWTGAMTRSQYGQHTPGYRSWGTNRAHRLAFLWVHGVIPDGLVLDHLCRVRHCVNPAHLDVVTSAENVLRGTGYAARNRRRSHCTRGHELPPLQPGQQRRTCVTCVNERSTVAHYATPTRSPVAGECDGCGQVRHVRVNGTMHRHKVIGGGPCPGSGRPARGEVAA